MVVAEEEAGLSFVFATAHTDILASDHLTPLS
jgi:hypothetical protein